MWLREKRAQFKAPPVYFTAEIAFNGGEIRGKFATPADARFDDGGTTFNLVTKKIPVPQA
jgi:hypothetical protein